MSYAPFSSTALQRCCGGPCCEAPRGRRRAASHAALYPTQHRRQIGRLEHELNKERVILGERDLELQRLRALARQMQVCGSQCAALRANVIFMSHAEHGGFDCARRRRYGSARQGSKQSGTMLRT